MTSRLPLALLVSAAVLPASGAEAAVFKRCGSFSSAGVKASYHAKGVSCGAAKRVLTEAGYTLCFDNQIPGWRKVWKGLPNGGRALLLKKGEKAIKTSACSPR